MGMNIEERSGIKCNLKEYEIPFMAKPNRIWKYQEFNFNSKELNDYLLDNSNFGMKFVQEMGKYK